MTAELESPRAAPPATPVAELELEQLARTAGDLALRDFLAMAEAWRIARALRAHKGNRSAAARDLGIGRRTLYTKMEKLGLVPTWTLGARSRGNGGAGSGNGASNGSG